MPRGLRAVVACAALMLCCAVCLADGESASGQTASRSIAIPPPVNESASGQTAARSIVNSSQHHSGRWAGDAGKFFKGAFAGLVGHEAGHYVANFEVGSDPFLRHVSYGPIPFFTIEPQRQLTRRDHYITASAGFSAQHIVNEWLLTKHPNLRGENEPFLKGTATFNFWLTVGYAATAFAGSGPSERDTKGMADALGWNERWVGALILAPTMLDAYRYNHPDAKWAKTASRLTKLLIIGLAAKAGD